MLISIFAAIACAAPSPETFALVIGNNVSATQQLPALQFADDDAMKYGTLLGGFLGDDHVQVVTRLDRDTARLFSGQGLKLSPPTRQVVESAFASLAQKLEAAKARGRPTAALFVFAGHGDLDQGRGFLELEDGRWTSDDMERALAALPADAVHVLLDSCNSFFVLNPRKPGGRRFATAKDAAESLAKRLPKVGVFLSTSAENETYEWSELGSGIFSHVVRSGLMGAADLDGDGAITYRELSSFVSIATQDIKNPNLRPHVFARGPGGANDGVLFTAPTQNSVVLKVKAELATRVQLRDHDGVRWLDLLAEAHSPFSIRIPESLTSLFEVRVERDAKQWEATLESARGEVELDALGRVASRGAQERGTNDSLRALFQTPYGPTSVQALAASEAARPEEVFGVSREDLGRLEAVTIRVAEQAHAKRLVGGWTSIAVGVAMGGVGAYLGGTGRMLSFSGTVPGAEGRGLATTQAGMFGVVALSLATVGVIQLLSLSSAERLYETHREALSGSAGTEAIASIDADLEEQLNNELKTQILQKSVGWAGISVTTVAMALGVAAATLSTEPTMRGLGDAGFLVGALGAVVFTQFLLGAYFGETPTQAIIRGWQQEPSRSRLKLEPSVYVTPSGGGVGLGGRF